MATDADCREGPAITALDTPTELVERAGVTVNDFKVPAFTNVIREIVVSGLPDLGTAAAGVPISSLIEIKGDIPSGAQQLGGLVGNFTAEGSSIHYSQALVHPARYFCNIPVRPGGNVQVEYIMSGTDFGGIHGAVGLIYGRPGEAVGFPASQYVSRETTISDVDTVTSLSEFRSVEKGTIKCPAGKSRISQIYFGTSPAYGTDISGTGDKTWSTILNLKGGGLAVSGKYNFLGHIGVSSALGATDSQLTLSPPVMYNVNIPVRQTFEIEPSVTLVGEDPGSVFSQVTLGFS
tara:strand:+ start:600 stop:1475 length:876 start_codon:yes stop_codon:yes gene_type:complete